MLSIRNTAAFIVMLTAAALSAQPTVQWQRSYGGSNTEQGYGIQQTTDGGYIVTSTTSSVNGDVFGLRGSIDFWVLKLDASGNVEWKKCLGGTNDEQPAAVRQTLDGGYIVTGYTRSNNWDVSGNHGDFDAWVVKLNGLGGIEWQRCYGGGGRDEAEDIRQTADGGYVFVGRSGVPGGDVTTNKGGGDCWVVKLDAGGNVEWQRSYGGSSTDLLRSIVPTSDGGYITVGETNSQDGDVVGNHGSIDSWALKLSADGKIEWQRALGGTGFDRGFDVVQSRDGGYAVLSRSYSSNGDLSVNRGGSDYWLAKLSGSGELEWGKTYGGSNEDWAKGLFQAADGGYVLVGQTQSNDGDALGNDGGADVWLIKTGELGDLIWQITLGGTKAEFGNCVFQTADQGYIFTGLSSSSDGDVTENKGSWDLWVVKLSPEPPSSAHEPQRPLGLYPNPATGAVTLRSPDGGELLRARVSDALGREAHAARLGSGGTLDVSHLPTGLYLVEAVSETGRAYWGRFLKE